MSEHASSRPLSVAIPKSFGAVGAYCLRRPNLSEILANEAPPPWTLSAFMAYLSQNHCLETLEFTMDASRYGKHYSKMTARVPGGAILPDTKEADYLKMLWARLMEAYIAPNGPREVNLPSEVRTDLMSLVDKLGLPPPPSSLDTAVQHIYTLMEESVLIQFLNSYSPQTAATEIGTLDSPLDVPDHNYPHTAHPTATSHSFDDRGSYLRSNRRSSPNHPSQPLSASYANPPSNRISAPPSTLSSFSRPSSRTFNPSSAPISRSLAASPASNVVESKSATPASTADSMDVSMTGIAAAVSNDDVLSTTESAASGTPASLSHAGTNASSIAGLHTPPTTPPMSDCQPYVSGGGGGGGLSDGGSPTLGAAAIGSPSADSSHGGQREGAWKRGMSMLGLRRSVRHRSQGSPDAVMEE